MGSVAAKSIPLTSAPPRFDAILDAAERVFASSGYNGVTMREISVGAGVAQGLIHYHFGNKETLFERMVERLAEKYYDPIARQFIAALMQSQPSLTRADAVWAYMFAIGVGMTMMAKTGRPARLSDGECDDGNADEMLHRIVPFICGGIRALT